jgi:ketosteroid isomerase-like protein
MKSLIVGLLVCGLVLVWTPAASAQAGDQEAVTEAFLAWIAARNAAEPDALAGMWTRPASYYGNGSLLMAFDMSPEQVQATIEAQFAAGRQDNLLAHHVEVTILGDAALVTCYLSGTFVLEPGSTMNGPWSMTSVWVRDGSGWKLLHFHQSLLAGSPADVLSGVTAD